LEPAAATLAAAPATVFVLAATGLAAAGTARAPMICRSELNKLPRRVCVDPAGF